MPTLAARHSVTSRFRVAERTACAAFVMLLAACGGDGAAPSGPSTSTGSTAPAVITAVSGGGQTGSAGTALAAPIVVRVTTATGNPVAGTAVAFQVTSGSAVLSSTTATTDATGQASIVVTLGSAAGAVQVTASVQGTSLSTTFSATASGPIASVTCTAAAVTTLAPGQVATPGATNVCAAGGTAGAEYALVAFNGASTARAMAAVTVQPTGIDAVSAPTLSARALRAARTVSPLGSWDALGTFGAPRAASGFEARLHARRAREMAPLIPAARAWRSSRGTASSARRTVIPGNVTVGQLVRLNASGNSPCASPDYRGARVEAVSSRAIIVADTSNPTGGFTSAEYQSIAATFDTIVDPVDTRNFGQPSDIDGNGRVVLFFTSAVNALTPRNSSSYVGGFFDSRDLFPTSASNGLPGCAGSNVAEMFYLLVPDPSGQVNGNRFSRTFVNTVTVSTVAHEYEHLINSSRRIYVNPDAVEFEEPWLDEGLAHIAEELYFHARSGLGPRQNLGIPQLRASAAITAAFMDGGVANFDRLQSYLENPSRHSPYADDDSLATRGAAWSFLRYAADQQTAAQETVWFRLVNSSATGLTNVRQVFGTDVASRFRDWALALLLDDVAGADARHQMPSWNYRDVYGALTSDGIYPLSTVVLSTGVPRTVAIAGGSAAYLRFAVGAGRTGAVSWSALPSGVTMTLVRLR